MGSVCAPGPDDRRGRRSHSADIYEFGGGNQGLCRRARRSRMHEQQRECSDEVGLCTSCETLLPSRSAFGPKHCVCNGDSAGRNGGVGPISVGGRAFGGTTAQDENDSVEGTLLGTSALFAGARGPN